MATFSAPFRTNVAAFDAGFDNLDTEEGTRRFNEIMAKQTVSLATQRLGTQELALHDLARTYKWKTFVRRLIKGEAVVIKAHLERRLRRALQRELTLQKEQIALMEMRLEAMDGGRADGDQVAPTVVALEAPYQTNRTGGA